MRTASRLCRLPLTFAPLAVALVIALAAALVPLVAAAQEADPTGQSGPAPAVFVGNPGWPAHPAPLDEQTLDAQRGRAPGMVMVVATPRTAGANGSRVTLWDEIAPPTPMPIPLDAQGAMQSNNASYTRK